MRGCDNLLRQKKFAPILLLQLPLTRSSSMKRELWAELSAAISGLQARPGRQAQPAYFTHHIGLIARVYLWAVLHQESVSWACRPDAWDHHTRPPRLPSQPTMSRRMQRKAFGQFMHKLGQRLGTMVTGLELVKRLDAKPMYVPRHTRDRDATWGRGAGQMMKGYKFHAIWGRGAMPLAMAVTGLGTDEKHVARDLLLPRLTGGGYVLSDSFNDSNPLHRVAAAKGHQLVAPRKRTHRGRGLGQRRHAPGRLRSIQLTEPPIASPFAQELCQMRRGIETRFAHATYFASGLQQLPTFVRGLRRVSQWIYAKLLINAARIRRLARNRA